MVDSRCELISPHDSTLNPTFSRAVDTDHLSRIYSKSGIYLKADMNVESNLSRAERTKLAGLFNSLQPLQSELSLPQFLALLQIALNPALSVNELSERLGCPQQTASRHVAALLGRYQGRVSALGAEGMARSKLDPLIVQEISQSDPRSRALSLSKYGIDLLRQLLTAINVKST